MQDTGSKKSEKSTPRQGLPKWPRIIWKHSQNPRNKPNSHPNILGIQPWIYDFAAYNLWIRPMGLLSCLNMLEKTGANVALLDCLSPTWKDVYWPQTQNYGQGHFPKVNIPKPRVLENIPRNFSRYGLDYPAVKGALRHIYPPPDLVLLTCSMTYWYLGTLVMQSLIRRIFPGVPIVLGGIYATLCQEHAQSLGVFDMVLQGQLEDSRNWKKLWGLLNCHPPQIPEDAGEDFEQGDFFPNDFSVILGSRGCPFSCAYCASSTLYSGFKQRKFEKIWQEVQYQLSKGVVDFVFYDDALLIRLENWLIPLLKELSRLNRKIRLHTPNAVHVSYLTPQICNLFYHAGLTTIRLGLESANFQARPDKKLSRQGWVYGVQNLFAAGFKPQQIGAYILFGLPEQDPEDIARTIRFAQYYNIRPHLAYYSPIPGSELFAKARESSPYPLQDEPLFQNRSIWPCYPGGFSWEEHKKWQSLLHNSILEAS